MDMRCIALLACGLALLAPRTLAQTCPPPGFDSAANLDFAKFIAAPWYAQMQEVPLSQLEQRLHCVVAHYRLPGFAEPRPPWASTGAVLYDNYDCTGVNLGCRFLGTINGVRNRNALSVQRDGMVGERGPNGNPDLRGAQDSAPTRASKLRVGPSFLESLRRIPGAFGPHWVVAFEPTNYDWAIVSPGAPHIRSNGACRAGNTGLMRFHTLGTGLRLFTRKPVDSASTAVMLQKLKDLGYDTSMLLPVQHTGCNYTAGVPVGAIHCAGTTCLAG